MSDSPASILFDENGNAVSVVADGPAFRLRNASQIEAIGRTVDDDNSTTTPLGSGATFTGAAVDVRRYVAARVAVFADQPSAIDGLQIQRSIDGNNWDIVDFFTIPAMAAGEGKTFVVQCDAQWFRVVYTNGSTAQSAFRLSTLLEPATGPSARHRIGSEIDAEDDADLAVAVITGLLPSGLYGDVSVTSDRRLLVSQSPGVPPDSTFVDITEHSEVPANTSDDNVYVIPNGKLLTVTKFGGGGVTTTSEETALFELFKRDSPSDPLTIISFGYAAGSTFQLDETIEVPGDGSREIVMRRTNNGGQPRQMSSQWQGFLKDL